MTLQQDQGIIPFMDYAIFEISGRQYLIKPGQTIEVDRISEDVKTLNIDKVLLVSNGKKIEIGKPYLKTTLNFEVVGNVRKPKVRVATYKAKANYRRVIGQKREMTRIKLADDKKSVKKA